MLNVLFGGSLTFVDLCLTHTLPPSDSDNLMIISHNLFVGLISGKPPLFGLLSQTLERELNLISLSKSEIREAVENNGNDCDAPSATV